MALSKSEYFKNLFATVTQSTGAIVNAQSPEEMRTFVRAAKIDAAINVRNWNKFIYPMMKTLRSAPEHEQDVLEHGIHGGTITTDLYATEDSMECLWDFTRGQPQSILGSILCLSARISNLAAEQIQAEEYDDSDLRSLIKCIELNLEQARKDLFADCYIWDCDGEPNLPYSLGRHIYEMFNQVIIGAPDIGLEGCFDDDYPTLSIENRVSTLIYDDYIPSEFVEYCVEGRSIFDALQATQVYIGMGDCFDESPDYSLQSPSAPTVGNHVLADGDSLTAGMKGIDLHMNFWHRITAGVAGGIISGDPFTESYGPMRKLNLVAGPGIGLDFFNSPPGSPMVDGIIISASGGQQDCCPLQQSYDAGAATSAGMIELDHTYPHDGAIIIKDDPAVPVAKELFATVVDLQVPTPVFLSGRHPLYLTGLGSTALHFQSTGVPGGPSSFMMYRNDGFSHPLYLHPLEYDSVPDTGGPLHPNSADPSFTYTNPEGALFVGNGSHPIPDRDGNPLAFGGLYYREPNSGDIWNLLCCGVGGGGGSENLQETYMIDNSGSGQPDGGRIDLLASADMPGIFIADDNPSIMAAADSFLAALYKQPLLSVGKSTQNADGDRFWSVTIPTGVEEPVVSNHSTPVNFSVRNGDPATPTFQGSLYCKVDAASGLAHPHWRDPNNGAVYDLTAGGGGGPLEAWRTISISVDGSATGASVSGSTMSPLVPQDMTSNLGFSAGNYINIDAVEQGTGLTDFLTFSVNPMPVGYCSDVTGTPPVADGDFLAWDAGVSSYEVSSMSSIGGGAAVYRGFDLATKDHQFASVISSGTHAAALNITAGATTVDLDLDPSQILVEDLGNVDYPVAPNPGDVLIWNPGTNKWEPGAQSYIFGNMEQWISAVEWDQRPESQDGQLNGPNAGGTFHGLHFQNNVHRGSVYVPSPGGNNTEWTAYNAVQFIFKQNMLWDDQLTYANVPVPRASDGAGGWLHPTKIIATGFFVAPATGGSYQPGDTVTYRLTVSDDGTPGQVETWEDGMTLNQFSFPSVVGVNGSSEVVSTDITQDYQVSVLEFDPIIIANNANSFICFRITPVQGTGWFNQDDVKHHFLGLRVDYTW